VPKDRTAACRKEFSNTESEARSIPSERHCPAPFCCFFFSMMKNPASASPWLLPGAFSAFDQGQKIWPFEVIADRHTGRTAAS